MTGIYGKLPAHGDFVRRGLPQSFVQPWDHWLQGGITAAQAALGPVFDARWAVAPAWRFHLPAGRCGPDAVAGVLLPSADAVGRLFPLTVAALLEAQDGPPAEAWFERLEQVAQAARDDGRPIDDLAAALPGVPAGQAGTLAEPAWWTANGGRVAAPTWPSAAQFVALLAPLGAAEPEPPAEPPPAACTPVVQAITHPGGVRSRNEDAFVERPDIGLWAVADGAGGHGAGDIASEAVEAALSALPGGLSAGEVLAQARLRLAEVHAALQGMSEGPEGRMPVTTVVVLMVRGDHFACLWAGDSRAYLLRQGQLLPVTQDHSLVRELVEAGMLRPEQAESHPQANVITRAVGGPDALALDKVAGRLQAGDRLLLCTDGLYKALPEGQIAQLLADGGDPAGLVEACLQAGAPDNVTALVVAV
jgi:serine/threonine protein phosphatase Stp1